MTTPLPLDLGDRVGVVGDAHGNTRFIVEAIWSLAERGVSSVVQLGDFGFIWRRGDAAGAALSVVNAALRIADLDLLVVLGNHENYNVLASLPRDEHGCIRIGRVVILPRSGRATAAGRAVGWLSGASSIDRSRRRRGLEWWPAEVPSDDEAAALVDAPGTADIVFAHEAIREPALLAQLESGWSAVDAQYANDAQEQFTARIASVLTDGGVVVSGHHHRRHTATATLARPDGTEIRARSEILAHEFQGPSVGILDIPTRQLETWMLDEQRQHRAGAEFAQLRKRLVVNDRALAARLGVELKTLRRLTTGALPAPDSMLTTMRTWLETASSHPPHPRRGRDAHTPAERGTEVE
ncbi:metallophosphoesterase [Microbacterium sp. Marseille-Q6965]|uniref:metallophosphoesterase n=1 Tax=Microbacterium sp. Marseille-Q6965 TaxID=2965072 RepID=UPI0021B77C4F|nr:metallophosphoesterase [Microbacterium sp. Marseille-Q6965]